ncbi:helix-turn-helix domain-containing protein [Sutterella sp.]|uniref:helix-turn-helix domain-containing protein n=1 Tax=Sutterella sp. TaxID=1981025 RepID=UPI0026DF71C4|nr:helix-turn-helix domain-containing protein [Sutterella sp.]MDO5532533.1 helix-turn-helix domain-containing protein [Sutterella sp.]
MGAPLSIARKNQILSLGRKGFNARETANIVGVHRSTVLEHWKAAGLKEHAGRHLSEAEIAELIELRWKGVSPLEAARAFGVTERSVVRHWESVTGKRLGENYSVITAEQTADLISLIRGGTAPETSAEILGITITHLGAALKSDPELAAAVTAGALPAWRDLMDAAVPVWTSGHYLTDAEIERIVAMRRSGKSVTETASAVGVSRWTVTRVLKKAPRETPAPRTVQTYDPRTRTITISVPERSAEELPRAPGVTEQTERTERTDRPVQKDTITGGPVREPGLAEGVRASPAARYIRLLKQYMTFTGLDAGTMGGRIGVEGERLAAWLARTASPDSEEAEKLEAYVRRHLSVEPEPSRYGDAPRGTIGERLRKLMERHDLSAPELARRIGVIDRSVRNWLNGTTPPAGKNLKLLAEVFKVSEDWLLYGDDLKRRFPRRNLPRKRVI